MSSPFSDQILRDWFMGSFPVPDGFPEVVATTGSGPFDEDNFDEILRAAGLEVDQVGANSDVIVVGRTSYSVEAIWQAIESPTVERVRVYSQEMILAFWASTRDPFAMPRESILRFASGHPVLEELSREWPNWPSTLVRQDDESPHLEGEWPQIGVLRAMGYVVGRNGLAETSRREVLSRTYLGPLPQVNSPYYMADWGDPGTPTRLHRIANSIAAFSRNAQRRRAANMREAINDWNSDLDWLRREYFRGGFRWPGY